MAEEEKKRQIVFSAMGDNIKKKKTDWRIHGGSTFYRQFWFYSSRRGFQPCA